MPDELSPSQAARRIGATTRTVQRWIALGRLPARRLGGRWRVASDALDAFLPSPSATNAGETIAGRTGLPAAIQPQTSPENAELPVDEGEVLPTIRTLFV